MDKAGGSAAADYIKGMKDDSPVFFTEVSAKAREGMKENVKAAMGVFAMRD